MTRKFVKLLAGLALVPLCVGCSLTSVWTGKNPPVTPQLMSSAKPEAAALVNYMNLNARRVQNLKARVDINAKIEKNHGGVSGLLACARPRDFRLRAEVLGKPAIDLGSNKDEFWYWVSQAPDPYVYHCSYADLATGTVQVPFPFQPDMVLAALGMAEYDEKAKYDLREYEKTVELAQETTSPAGQTVRRVTVFNRMVAQPGQPQVIAHVLQDQRGKLICKAVVQKVMVERQTGATIPTKLSLDWPEHKMSMEMTLSSVQCDAIDATQAGRMFSRADLAHQAFDLARRVVDTPGAVRRAGASVLPGR